MSVTIKAYSKEKQRKLNGEDITAIDREEYSTNHQIYDYNKIQAEIPPSLQPGILPPLAKDALVPGGDWSNPKINFVFVIHLNLTKPVTNTPKSC
jgi:hypothetical protein